MANPSRLIIYGTGGLGREVHDIVQRINQVEPTYEIQGWIDDNLVLAGTSVRGLPVLGTQEWLERHAGQALQVVVAVGIPEIRRRLFLAVEKLGHICESIIDPSVIIGGAVTIGHGAILMQNAVLTADVSLGKGVIMNAGCVAAHDSRLADFATMAPLSGLMGYAGVDEGANLGAGAIVLPSVTAGAWSILGAGTILTEANEPNTTVVGTPGKVIKQREAGWHL